MLHIMKPVRIVAMVLIAVMLFAGCGIPADSAENPEATEVSPDGTLVPETLFDFYTVPTDWPRVVPIMSEFHVTAYKWTGNEMYAAGYGDVGMSRAKNYYTNAQKIHVSSNIWEQDTDNSSVTEGSEQTFNYIGEGNTLKVVLREAGENSISFELYFMAARE